MFNILHHAISFASSYIGSQNTWALHRSPRVSVGAFIAIIPPVHLAALTAGPLNSRLLSPLRLSEPKRR